MGAELHLPESAMPARAGVVPSLDGLRAVSIALVLLAHLVSDRWFPGGFGVLTFFVISGFLITRLLLAEFKARATISLGSFYLRRILRLYPAVLVYTAVVTAVYLIAAPNLIDWPEPMSALFYYANYLFVYYNVQHVQVTMPFTHFWSLSIEEQFYIFFPAILLLCRGRAAAIAAVAAAVCAIALALRIYGALRHPELLGTEYFYLRTEMRMDSIAFGVLIAAACDLPRGRRLILWLVRPVPVIIALLIAVACFADREPFFRETARYTLLAAAIAIGLCAVVFGQRYAAANRILNSRPAVWVGRLSYSLYVWHLATAEVIRHYFASLPHPVVAALALAACVIAAALSYYGLERPLIGLRRQFGSRTADRPALG
jgi:peptidoglycan/LPS O-acetylase OafA/YrhL